MPPRHNPPADLKQPDQEHTALRLIARMLAVELHELQRPPEPAKEVLKVREAAAFLGCSPAQIYVLEREHGLPTKAFGCERRILRSELMAWLERQPSGGDAR